LKVPATEGETTLYQTNSIDALWWNAAQNTWGYAVHKYVFNYGPVPPPNLGGVTYSPRTFNEARLQLVENLSQRRGRVLTLTIDEATGEVIRIDLQELESVYIGGIVAHGSSTNIDRSAYTLETGRYPVRFDVNGVSFWTVNVDPTIQVGDFAVWWLDDEDWKIQRATPIVGRLSKDTSGPYSGYYRIMNDGEADIVRYEADCSRFNLATSVRPSQFYSAYTRLSLTGRSVTVWCTPDSGNPIGFTYGDSASSKSALELAVTNAEAAKVGVVIATAASEVDLGVKWVTQATMDSYDAAIASAKAVRDNPASVAINYTAAIYDLGQAYGAVGATPPGFIGSQGTGTKPLAP
jgi:hypothetical protein